MSSSFDINGRKIGDNHPTYIVAEIGANHNGDVNLAKRMIEVAVECGVDAVKFQTYTAEELVSDADRVLTWGPKDKQKSETIGKMFNRIALPREAHKEVFEYANRLGIMAFSTPFSIKGVEFLNKLQVPCFKVAASDVDYLDMLKEIGKTKKPVMLSLGKCTLGEADLAVETLIQSGCEKIVIMHCVSQYPSPINEMNLKVIEGLKSIYPEFVIGFSDHSMGITADLGAVALGAKVIEKHFTLDKNMDGPDHWFSMDPKDMKSLVREVRNLEAAMGHPRKRVLKCEEQGRKNSIRSLVVNRDIMKGEVIKKEDLVALRPGYGIKPYDKEKIIGLKINKELKSGTVLTWDHFK
ncbi:N-acetylneuraminate synthase family protein [Clostridium cochlearium]|uniref:N-acetylneuraminate synthase n=1 Tax=Clostridium cochlearium TaxID=1494 RepID=A0A2X2YB58_CLOCO|nr:N-acetylneuraminate synthase family protein [Clostridium cochlearium]SQB35750.1 N-acetylneuraminate synthase [Clostridium cochlearium]